MKRTSKKPLWKKVAGLHARVSVWMFVSYLILSVAYSPEFLVSDIRHKFQALADDTIVITGRVLGPPQKPDVSASSDCRSGTLSVSLDWSDDDASQSYDILRDGTPLVTGIAASSYTDSAVSTGETYVYEVVARGVMDPGYASSDPVSVTMPEECVVVFVPEVNIVTFQGKAISDYVGIPKTDSRKPTFTGTTNIPLAQVDVLINDSIVVSARVTANGNGYWSFRVPTNLSYGTHTVFVTASDPSDPSITSSRSLMFKITKKSDDGQDGGGSDQGSPPPSAGSAVPSSRPVSGSSEPVLTESGTVPIDFTLRTETTETYQGRELPFVLSVVRLDPAFEGVTALARYSLLDRTGNTLVSSTGNVTLRLGESIRDRIYVPLYASGGEYRLHVELVFAKSMAIREVPVRVLPLPLLSFGNGIILTYPDLLSRIGTISLLLLLLLLLWLSLFIREYLMYSESLRHITERNLIGAGFFGRRKGKGVSG